MLFSSIFDAANVANLHRRAIDISYNQIFHLARIAEPAQGSQHQLALTGLDVATGHVGVLALKSVAHGRDWNFVSCKSLGVDPDIDRALQAADDIDFADAFGSLELRPHDFVAVFGQLAN